MEIILKTNNNRSAYASVFGIKGLSIENNLITLKQLKEMDYSNTFISLNKNMFNSDLDNLENTLIELSKLCVRGVFFYDISILSIVKRLDLDINLIWAQDFLTTNYKTCDFYYKEGVKGVNISSVLTIDEICEISKNTKLDTYVNIFGYQLMGLSRRSLISNYLEYIGEENNEKSHYMIEKDIKYRIVEEDFGTKLYSSYILNGIKYLNKLKESGVKYIILDSFDIDEDIFSKIVSIYERGLNSDIDLIFLEDEINGIIKTELGFFNKKTIYRVKRK